MFNPKKIFVIAEMANAHEGNLDNAKKIVRAASDAKADAMKFQKFFTSELLTKDHNQFNHFKKLEMNDIEWTELINYSKKLGLKVFMDVFGIKSANSVLKMKIDGFKLHSTDISNPNLLAFFAKRKEPLLISTAGCYPEEIEHAISIAQKTKKEIILMHGFQGFPTKLEDTNLLRIQTIKEKFSLPVGMMDHISADSKMAMNISLLSVGMGAQVIEKHITLNRNLKRIDYYSSLNPDEFKKFVSLVHMTYRSLGTKSFALSNNEKKYRLKQKKSTIAKKSIQKGKSIVPELFEYKRTNSNQETIPYYKFENKMAKKNIEKGTLLTNSLVKTNKKKVVAVLACRAESSRLYGKPMQNLDNIPIIQFLISQIFKSTLIDDVILAISENPGNEIFVEFAKKQNLKFIIGNDRDVLARLIQSGKKCNADVVFRVTSENPFIYWEGIDKLIQSHFSKNFDFSYLQNVPIGSGFELINMESLEKSHNLGKRKHRSELCSLYIFENKKSFKINVVEPPKNIAKPQIRLTVDTPEDLLVARIIFKKLIKKNNPIKLSKIIQFLEQNPQILEINSGIPLGVTRIWN